MLEKLLLKVESIDRKLTFPYTRASIKRKAIFLHIPKTGGTSVKVALGESEKRRHHFPWWVYQQGSPKRFEKFYKFAFVRNPIDRIISGYSYLKAGGNKISDFEVANHLDQYDNFDDFVQFELFKGKMIYHPIFRPQTWYLCDCFGRIKVDYVGRYESFDSDFVEVARQLNIDKLSGLPVINKSPNSLITLNQLSKTIIYDIYRDDYDIFKYSI